MNLLRIIASMDPASGGPCQGIRNAIPELEKKGVHNEVVCLDDAASSFLTKDPFKIHALGPGKGPWNFNKKLIPWLIHNLGRFDAVIIHGLWLYHSYAVHKAVGKFRRLQIHAETKKPVPRVFVMPHGMLDPYFQRSRERRFKAIRNWIYWKLVESSVVNDADGLLFTCQAEVRLARESFQPYFPKREINVGYGIQPPPEYTNAMTEAFLQKCPRANGDAYILFLSRIHEKKGVDLLIQAFSRVVAERNREKLQPDIKLMIAGPGLDTPYGQLMQELVIKNAEIKDLVLFPGMLTGDAKWGAFYGCDAFILPSHQENFGIAVAEALACGKPVLISNQVNIWEEIERSGGGLVEDDNADGTWKLLNCWLNLPLEEKTKLQERAIGTFHHYFHIERATQQWLESISMNQQA